MLKNRKKYEKLKPIDLENFKTINKKKLTGISTETYGSKWFLLPKGKAIFKTFDDDYFPAIKKFRYINEILCCELAKMINVPCATYEPAYDNKNGKVIKGLVSYKVNSTHQKLMTAYDVSNYIQSSTLGEIIDEIEEKTEDDGYVLDNDFEFDLFKLTVFDYLSMQQDRHLSNIHIIDDKKNNFRYLSPIIDNEMAFGVISIDKLMSCNFKVTVHSIVDDMNLMARSINSLCINNNHNYEDNINDLVKLAKTHKRYYEFLVNAVKNFDVKRAIQILQDKGIEIPNNYKNYLISLNKYIRKDFVRCIKQNKNLNNEIEL